MLEAAAEQFGGKSEEDIKEICLVSLGSYWGWGLMAVSLNK